MKKDVNNLESKPKSGDQSGAEPEGLHCGSGILIDLAQEQIQAGISEETVEQRISRWHDTGYSGYGVRFSERLEVKKGVSVETAMIPAEFAEKAKNMLGKKVSAEMQTDHQTGFSQVLKLNLLN